MKRRLRAAVEKAEPETSWSERFASRWTMLRNFVLNAVGLVVFVGAAWLLWGAVTKPTIAIAPISMPEELEKKQGYTPELMAHKLRAAVLKLTEQAKSRKGGAEVTGRSDIPDIVVPRTGLSVETIAAQIRKILGRSNRWQVSGGVAVKGNLYEMNIKIANDVQSYLDGEPIAGKDIDPSIEMSARGILGAADPFLLAASYRTVGNLNASLDIAHKIIELYPKAEGVVWAHNLIGNVLADQGRREEAIVEYKKAMELDPKFANPHSGLGSILLGQGKAEEASAEYRKAIELDPKFANPHVGLGVVLRDQGKPVEASAEYRKAIEIDPKFANPHVGLGVVLRDQGKPDEATAEYRKAIELDPKYAAPHNNLGKVLDDQGKPDEAIAEYRKAIELDPKIGHPHNNLGNILRDQGKPDEAIAEYKKAIELDPKAALPHNSLGNVLADQGKPDEATAEYRKAIELDRKFAYPHNNLGDVLRDHGKLDEAIAEYRKAVELAPDNARFKFGLENAEQEQREARERPGASNPAAPTAKKK